MSNEVQRQLDLKNASYQRVSNNVAEAAKTQSPETIDQAINCFASVLINDSSELQSYLHTHTVPEAGFVDSPLTYFSAASSRLSGLNGMVPLNDVRQILRNRDLNFQNGIKDFLKIGIQEALNGLKIIPNPRIPNPTIAPPIDELLTPDKLTNPSRALLQASVRAIMNMFSALKNMQISHTDLQFNVVRIVRA
jgi:hypothetical protein